MTPMHSNIYKKILYIESNIDGTIGGSYFSLLFLTKHLNKDRYIPIVIFYRENELIDKFKDAGCKVIVMRKKIPLNLVLKLNSFLDDIKLTFLFPALKHPALFFQKITNYSSTFLVPSFQCWRILKKESIDIVHLNNTLLRPQEWILASLFTKAKVVAHERGINNTFPVQSRFWAQFIKAFFCISEAVKNNLIQNGFSSSRLFLVYNGIDPLEYKASRSKENIFHNFAIDESSPLLGVVGNIKQWKGQETAINAMAEVVKKYPQAKCLLIGGHAPNDHKYYNYIVNLVGEKNLTDNIIFAGHRKDVPSLINVLNLLVHTSVLPEPFGRVLLEGMSMSKPVITPDIGAGPEIVLNGETGLVFKAGDSDDLARCIIYLLENPEIAAKMGQQGRERVDTHFHIHSNTRQTEKIYERILSN
jgi:glycosyltransferase involved in cell wall biosynthesis